MQGKGLSLKLRYAIGSDRHKKRSKIILRVPSARTRNRRSFPVVSIRTWTTPRRAEGALYTAMTEERTANENLPSFSRSPPPRPPSPVRLLSPSFPPPLHHDKCITTGTRCTFMKLSAFHWPRYGGMEKNRHLSHVRRLDYPRVTSPTFFSRSLARAKLTSRKLAASTPQSV